MYTIGKARRQAHPLKQLAFTATFVLSGRSFSSRPKKQKEIKMKIEIEDASLVSKHGA